MVSLREKQKERRERSILSATAELLELKGYNNTSIEEIADKAEVGVGTVYNYFHSKAELVLELSKQWTTEILKKGQAIVDNPPSDPIEAVSSLFCIYIEVFISGHSKSLLRELFAITFTEQISYAKEQLKLDYALIAQVARLMKKIKKRGQLVRGVKPEEAAYLLYMASMTNLLVFIFDDEVTLEPAMKAMQQSVRLIFHGLAPK